MSQSYKNIVKDKARRNLWERAVSVLTTNRSKARVLEESFARKLWDYCFDDYLLKYGVVERSNKHFLESWCSFARNVYNSRTPGDLRVAYLSGPEPENDLQTLLDLGVRIENVWAVEVEGSIYREALENASRQFPTLKLFYGSLLSLLEVNPTPLFYTFIV